LCFHQTTAIGPKMTEEDSEIDFSLDKKKKKKKKGFNLDEDLGGAGRSSIKAVS
jgi:hypothetical protein